VITLARIRATLNLAGHEPVVFSCRGDILESKFGKTSKPSPRTFVVTRSKFYIVTQSLVNKQIQIGIQRTIPLGAIKFIGTSTCRDDWFSLGVGSPQEADPLLNCVLKTELFTQMQQVMPGGFNLKIFDSIEYAKKPGKIQLIKVVKDSTMAQDFYKSQTIHTSQGEPPNSVSRPMPKAKPIPAKPFTKGRLIRPGGPSGQPSKLSNGNRNTKPVSDSYAHATSQSRQVPRPIATSVPSHTRNTSSTSSGRAVPLPPPLAPPAASKEPQYRVLYDFSGQSTNEVTLKAGDLITILQKENNGKRPRTNQDQS
jgi:myosin-1